MRTKDLIEDMESADAAGHEIIIWEEQYRGSPAAYAISEWDFVEVEDEDAEPEMVDCEDCGGNGEVEDFETGEFERCEGCDGDGEVESGEIPKKTVLAIKISHEGYAPGGLRS